MLCEDADWLRRTHAFFRIAVAFVARESLIPAPNINDRDLLALRPEGPRHDSRQPDWGRMLFVNPSDENGFPLQ